MPKKDVLRRIDQNNIMNSGGSGATRLYPAGSKPQVSGSLAGWTIELGHLYAGTGATRAGMMPGSYPFYSGHDIPEFAPFRVTPAGDLFASSATITGAITTGPDSDIDGQYIVVDSITADKILVTDLSAINADLGNITAGTVVITTTDEQNNIWLNDADDGALAIGGTVKANAPFTVSAAGVLTATGAVISGSLSATTGTIGGWSIDASKIYNTNSHLNSSGYISFGATPPTTYGNNVGAWLGYSSGAKISLYADANNYLQWDGSKLIFKGENTALDASGNLTVSSASVSGAITATTGSIGGFTIATSELYAGSGASRVGLLPGTYPFYAGAEDASAAPFRVTAAGDLTATSGSILGSLYVGASAPRIHIDGANKLFETTDFVSNTSGLRIDGATGNAEFNDITARGAIKTAVFQKSLVTAFAGSQTVSKSASTLSYNATLSGTTYTLIVKLQDGGAPFANGDLIYIKTETIATYATVNTGSAYGSTSWSYTATYKSGTNAGTVYAGTAVIDYGVNDDGRLFMTADQTYAPYLSIATHNMDTPPAWTEKVRLGKLDGIAGTSGYGLWSDNVFLTGKIIITNPEDIKTSEITNDSSWTSETGVTSFVQASAPSALKIGDLWFDSDDGNKLYRAAAVGSANWVAVQDTAYTTKGSMFYQTEIPTALKAGDLWVDTNDGNKLYSAEAAGANEIKAGEWVLVQDAASKAKTFYQAAIPVSMAIGDLWIDSDDGNKLYRAESVGADQITAGEWVIAQDTAYTTKGTIFYQDAIPTSLKAGDLWIDTNDSYKLYSAVIAGANEIKAGEWVLVQNSADAAKTATDYIDSTGKLVKATAPSGSGLYLDSTHMGYYSGSAWTSYMDNSGKFYFAGSAGAHIEWDGTDLKGTDGTNVQWYARASTGKFYAGGGAVILDVDGLSLTVGENAYNQIKFFSGATATAAIYSWENAGVSTLSMITSTALTTSNVTIRAGSTSGMSRLALTSDSTGDYIYMIGDAAVINFIEATTQRNVFEIKDQFNTVFTSVTSDGRVNSRELMASNTGTLGSEVLTDGPFDSGTTHWSITGDFAFSSGSFIYTHSSGVGTLTQTAAKAPMRPNRMYALALNTTSRSIGYTITIPATVAEVATIVVEAIGATTTVYFKTIASPGNFQITVASTSGGFSLNSLSLKPVEAGDLIVSGTSYLGTISTVGGATINEDGLSVDTRIEGDTDANLVFIDASADKVGIGNNAPAEKLHVTGNLQYTGDFKPYRNSTAYTGYVFVPLTTALTSTSYDGNDTVAVGTTNIDTSSVFSAPVGIKAALIQVSAAWASASASNYLALRPLGGSVNMSKLVAHDTLAQDMTVICPCDANGDIDVVVAGANATNVVIRIWGYFI